MSVSSPPEAMDTALDGAYLDLGEFGDLVVGEAFGVPTEDLPVGSVGVL